MGSYSGNGAGNMMMNRPQYNNTSAAGIAPNNPMVRAQRPPNVTVGPDGMNVWRQQQMAAMQQQQQQQVQQVSQTPAQQQQMARFQQQQQQQQGTNPNVRMQATYMQQQQTYMHSSNQGNMQQQVAIIRQPIKKRSIFNIISFIIS